MSVPNDLNRFSVNPTNIDISRSVFNRNHSVKFSCNLGECIPFYVDEVLPGDTFSVDTSKVCRLQPLVTPIMDEVFLDTYYFFVPNRLIWEHWKEFNGENTESPWVPETTYTIPQTTIPDGGYDIGTIADYMGIPVKTGEKESVSSLPFRAYALCVDQWFRDQNNENPVHVSLKDTTTPGSNGSDQTTDIEKGGKPFIACKLHDYFTSCLPDTQKGDPVTINVGGYAPVLPQLDMRSLSIGEPLPSGVDRGVHLVGTDTTNTVKGLSSQLDLQSRLSSNPLSDSTSNYDMILGFHKSGGSEASEALIPSNLFADLSVAGGGVNVNELRSAFAIQKYFESLARGGSRYIEVIKSLFGVTSPDSRIQRTEYLGGNRVPLNVSQVEQTSATETDIPTPQGNVVGMSLTGNVNSDFTKSFTEHGYIIGIAVARYRHTYQQGLERHWSRKTIYDYYNPKFANLGEQAVFEKEIYLQNKPSEGENPNDDVFGYQEAWADLRYKPSRVAGEMRSAHTTPLDMWHLADYYGSAPRLSDGWIREDARNLDRCLAVSSSVSNQLICDFYITNHVARPMPLYSIPGLIDHH